LGRENPLPNPTHLGGVWEGVLPTNQPGSALDGCIVVIEGPSLIQSDNTLLELTWHSQTPICKVYASMKNNIIITL